MSHYLDRVLPFDPNASISEDDFQRLARDLAIDLEEFAQKLRIGWPQGRVDVFVSKNRVEWQIPEPRPDQNTPDGGDGSLTDGCIVEHYYFPLEVTAEFALWYRGYIPLKHRLFLMGESGC